MPSQILPIAHVASYVKILDNPIQFSFCHGKELYNPIITNLAIFNTQNLGDITIKGDNFSYTESNTSLADYVVHTKLDEKFIDLTKCGKSFWAKEFKNLAKDFDKSIKFFFSLRYIPSNKVMTGEEFKEIFGMLLFRSAVLF